MYLENIGQGPDLVLIHGWAMHGGIFAPLADILRANFTLHLVDLPGHGFSRDDTTELDPQRCVEALIGKVPRAIWIGWSLGGLISLSAALSYPEHVRGIVEIAASPRFLEAPDWPHGVSPSTFEQFERGLRDDYRVVVERFLALEVLGSPDAQTQLRQLRLRTFERGAPAIDALKQGMQILERADMRSGMARLAIPNLWIAGRRDRLVPPAAMKWSAQQNPMGRFLELPSGHAPFIADAPAVANAIAQFAGTITA
ncbi:MAG TPA: pimeloyl-ACP methyl ester esterase BioH [Rudaea sp.]|jgi:pimeloyl-[acyl-carrier protein] methyl ester esterase|nr:pimeloyl-ACP methyl ester esterase BioH [Rudaea sp.]